MVENLVAIELAYINTKHPDFYKEIAMVPSMIKSGDPNRPNRPKSMYGKTPAEEQAVSIYTLKQITRKVHIIWEHFLIIYF